MNSCSMCEYYGHDHCRINPPQVFHAPEYEGEFLSVWPTVSPTDVCGKFEIRFGHRICFRCKKLFRDSETFIHKNKWLEYRFMCEGCYSDE